MIVIIVICVIPYLIISGAISNAVRQGRGKRCPRSLKAYPHNCDHLHGVTEFLIGVFWPICLPWAIGFVASAWWSGRDERAEERRIRERREYEAAKKFLHQQGVEWPSLLDEVA